MALLPSNPWSEDDEVNLLAAVLEIAKEPAESYKPWINPFVRIGKIINKSFTNKEVLVKINELKTRCEGKCREVQNQDYVKTPVFEMGVKIWGDAIMKVNDMENLLPQSPANVHDIEDHQDLQTENQQTAKPKSTALVMDTISCKASRPKLKQSSEAILEEGDKRSKNEDESDNPLGKNKMIRKRTCFLCGKSGHFIRECPEKEIVNILNKQQEDEEIPKDTVSLQIESKNNPDEQPNAHVSASIANVHHAEDHQEFHAEIEQNTKPKSTASVMDTTSVKTSRPELKRAHEVINEEEDKTLKNEDESGEPIGWKKKMRKETCFACGNHGHFARDCPDEKNIANVLTKQQEHEEIPKDTVCLQYKSKNKPDEQPSALVSASTANVHDADDHQEFHAEIEQNTKPESTASVKDTTSVRTSGPELKRAHEVINEEEDKTSKNEAESGEPIGWKKKMRKDTCFACGNHGHFARDCPDEKKIANVLTKQQEHEEIPKDTVCLQYKSKNKPDEQPSALVSASTANVHDIEDHQELQAEIQQAAKPKSTASVMDTISVKASRPELKRAREAINEEDDKRFKNGEGRGKPIGMKEKRRNGTCFTCGDHGHFVRDCPKEKKSVNILTKQQEHEEIPKDTVGYESKNNPDEQPSAPVSASSEIGPHQPESRPIEQTNEVSNSQETGSHSLEPLETEQRKEVPNNNKGAAHQLKPHNAERRDSASNNTKTGSHHASSEKKEANASNSQSRSHRRKQRKAFNRLEAGYHRLDPPRWIPGLDPPRWIAPLPHTSVLPPPPHWVPPMAMPYPPPLPYRYPPPPPPYPQQPPPYRYHMPNPPVAAFNPPPTENPAWFSSRHR